MDGILSNGEGLEIKSINEYGFKEVCQFGPKKEHKSQVNAYMMCRPDIDLFRIVYENKNTQLAKEFVVPRDQKYIDEIMESLDSVITHTWVERFAEMLPDCKQARGFQYNFCPYRDICEDAKWPESESSRTLGTSNSAKN